MPYTPVALKPTLRMWRKSEVALNPKDWQSVSVSFSEPIWVRFFASFVMTSLNVHYIP